MKLPDESDVEVTNGLSKSSTELDIFFSFLDENFFKLILEHTNERLLTYGTEKKKSIQLATLSEIYAVFGIILVSCYNYLPRMRMYWSQKPSLGNTLIKETMSQDRFKLLFSKLYFNTPNKPVNAEKLHYLEKVVPIFNNSFQRVRSNCTHQSRDEMMTKFKGRLAFKQFNPMKPIKRGIKSWNRCDALTGYVYDMQIYCGKDDKKTPGCTLGESVVLGLLDAVPKSEQQKITMCFDRFFSTIELFKNIQCCAVGTIQKKSKKPTKIRR